MAFRKKLKGVGFDAVSVDPVDAPSSDIHRILLSKGLVILENLRNLDKVGYDPFCMAALPYLWKIRTVAPQG